MMYYLFKIDINKTNENKITDTSQVLWNLS